MIGLEKNSSLPELKNRQYFDLTLILNLDRQLRAPLNSISGLLDFLSTTHLSVDQKKFVEGLNVAADELGQLLETLRHLIHAETHTGGFSSVKFASKELNRRLNEIISEVSQPIQMQSQIDGSINLLSGDLESFVLITHGLVEFAVSAGDGQVSLNVRNTQVTNSRVHLKIDLWQSACHLNEPQLNKALAMVPMNGFYAKIPLKLVLAKMLANNHQITYNWVLDNSKLLITFYFEFIKHDQNEGFTEIKPLSIPSAVGKAILIAEDNELNKIVLRMMLESIGCEVWEASNGKEALERAAEREFDSILMDIEMPVMDGIEATSRIRKLKGNQPRIIAVSADAFASDPAKYRKSGFDDFLCKPVNKEVLKEVLLMTTRS